MEQALPSSNQTPPEQSGSHWHLALFKKSVLKQRKLSEISSMLADVSGKVCLDLGSDNGVISYYLRQLGGTWHSADLTTQAVDSIRSLVGDNVELLDGKTFPYSDATFDVVAVVDMLEHVEDDQLFVAELFRIIKPGGQLIINAPNLKPGSPLRAFRHMIGQTDEAHGHLRPGYSKAQLEELLAEKFSLERTHTYSRFFSELIDTGIVFAYSLISGKSGAAESGEPSKGLVITERELKKHERNFKLYSAIYPLVWLVSRIDYLIPFIPGFMRIALCRRK